MNRYTTFGSFCLIPSLFFSLLFFCTVSYGGDEGNYVAIDAEGHQSPAQKLPQQTIEQESDGKSPLPPLRLERRRSSLLNAYTIDSKEFGTQVPSLQTYGAVTKEGLSPNELATAWNKPSLFAFSLDKKFFAQPDIKAIACWLFLAATCGIVPSSPACGYLIRSIGNFTRLPNPDVPGANPAYSQAAIAWITISTAPAFIMAWYLGCKALFQKQSLTPPRSKLDNQPHVLDKNRLHKTLIVFGAFSSAICAAVPTALLYDTEKNFPLFFMITVAPFYLTWAGLYFDETSLVTNQLFQRFSYRGVNSQLKKNILLQKIGAFKTTLKIADSSFVEKAFSYINKGPAQELCEEAPFIFSLFFVKSEKRAELGNIQSAPLLNFRMDMETVQSSNLAALLASLFIGGTGSYTKFYIMQPVLKNAFLSMGLEEKHADIASTTLSAFETPFRTILMAGVQTRFLQDLPKVFSLKHLNNYPCTRKMAGTTASINAVLFSLPMVVAGLEVYKDSSASEKFFHIFPAFFNDFSFYEQTFNTYINQFLTHMVTLKPKNIQSIERKKAYVSYYADKAFKWTGGFDNETLDEIYRRTQDAN